jgi:hypothetical protein
MKFSRLGIRLCIPIVGI